MALADKQIPDQQNGKEDRNKIQDVELEDGFAGALFSFSMGRIPVLLSRATANAIYVISQARYGSPRLLSIRIDKVLC